MGEIINNIELTAFQWFLFMLCGTLIGMSKTGLSGLGLIVVPIMVTLFGGKHSVGILLPILIVADIFAVQYYNRHANWRFVWLLLPWAVMGIVLGALLGNGINDDTFKKLLAAIILFGVALMIWKDIFGKNIKIPDNWWFAALLGLAGGFTSMVGNAAGPIMSLYLLSMRLPKNSYIGTGAWFFFIINVIKVPFHIFIWKTIHVSALKLDIMVLPGVFLGIFLGIKLVKLFPEKAYRVFIIASTIASALFLF